MWRNTMVPVRLYIVDARALIPVMIFLVHWRWSTLYLAGAGSPSLPCWSGSG